MSRVPGVNSRGILPDDGQYGLNLEFHSPIRRKRTKMLRYPNASWFPGSLAVPERDFFLSSPDPREEKGGYAPGPLNSLRVSAISVSFLSTRKFTVSLSNVPSARRSPAFTPVSTSIPSSMVLTG